MSIDTQVNRRTEGSGAFVVETSRLRKRFGDRVAVDDVDLRVPRGSAFGYLGPNGAGKTTLIRMLLGLTGATSGTMHLLGRPVPAERRAALARVGAIVEEPRFHGHLTGRENLTVIAAAREPEAHDRIDGALAWHGAAEQMHRAGGCAGQPEQHPDQGRFPGAVRPQVAEGRAAGNAEVNVVDGDTVAESLP
jgi:ABC-type sugar transport system ATPase subunit